MASLREALFRISSGITFRRITVRFMLFLFDWERAFPRSRCEFLGAIGELNHSLESSLSFKFW